MKFSQFFKVMILAAAIGLTSTAFAAGAAHKGSVSISDSVQVNGKQLPAGEYAVVWDGDGPSVNLRILRGGKEVASTPATVTKLDNKAPENAAETRNAGGAGRQLTAIRFSGKNYQLDIPTTASQAEVKSTDSVK